MKGYSSAVVALCLLVTSASAQTTHRLAEPEAWFPDPFTQVRGLVELPDGRVLVTDWVEERLVVLDFDAGVAEDLYRVGGGPREYRLPQRLLELPADSVLLVDQGNQRQLVLDPDLAITRVHRGPSAYRFTRVPRAIDAQGSFYFTLPGWATGRRPGSRDSTEIVRWDRGL